MMRVRYFPHTHMSDAVAQALMKLFDEVVITKASTADPAPEGVTALGPSPEEEARLGALLADWRRFSGLHGEGVATYARGMGQRVDPLDELLASQIKCELQRQIKGDAARNEGADAVTTARALLSLAAEYDLRRRDLDDDLSRIEARQQALLDTLKGEVAELPEAAPHGEAAGEVKMMRRLSAWATLFTAEGEACPDRFFVTTSREALALVAEHGGLVLEELGVLRGGDLGRGNLESLLAGGPSVGSPETGSDDGGVPVTFTICIARGEHPYNLFNRFARGTNVSLKGQDVQGSEIKEDMVFVLAEEIAPD
ncbi:hypothetical protein [Desulfoluna butyratoxydans]|uniref:Uncharacterized protein n=1 Tax=Desulfoluna butyratoxydans TaxID=231438 RepID=A0A4U8YVL6_9BACT|nr:hypothetical protein [Desulfoluna butyratoxydans]VFQ46012.1 hypothetical protein MSL71_36750 [Desulfoluna butyratoxydans]